MHFVMLNGYLWYVKKHANKWYTQVENKSVVKVVSNKPWKDSIFYSRESISQSKTRGKKEHYIVIRSVQEHGTVIHVCTHNSAANVWHEVPD